MWTTIRLIIWTTRDITWQGIMSCKAQLPCTNEKIDTITETEFQMWSSLQMSKFMEAGSGLTTKIVDEEEITKKTIWTRWPPQWKVWPSQRIAFAKSLPPTKVAWQLASLSQIWAPSFCSGLNNKRLEARDKKTQRTWPSERTLWAAPAVAM